MYGITMVTMKCPSLRHRLKWLLLKLVFAVLYQTKHIYSLFSIKQIAILCGVIQHIISITFSVPVLMAIPVANLRRSPSLVWEMSIDYSLNVAGVRLSSWKLDDLPH